MAGIEVHQTRRRRGRIIHVRKNAAGMLEAG